MKDEITTMNIDDALIEKPYPFVVEEEGKGERHFLLYPVTLGKLHLLKRHMDNLEVNYEAIKTNPHLEALRVVTTKTEEVCKVFAYHTLKRKRDIFDTQLIQDTATYIRNNASYEDMATLLLFILSRDNIELFKEHLGITKENDRMRRVIQAKAKAEKSKNDFEFGGKTIYGTLIDLACERYGWSYDYVIWGISLVNLHLLLADRIHNVYISDDAKKHITPSLLVSDDNVISGDDKENMEKIHSMDWR